MGDDARTIGYIGPVAKVSNVTLTFEQYQRLVGQLDVAVNVICAMLEAEGLRTCPACGYRLKQDEPTFDMPQGM